MPFVGFDHVTEGAKYLRADLHVHSYGASPDVKDAQMTVPNIVTKALERGIDLLAITDHNEIASVEPLIACAEANGLAVLCGVEISATEGHLLAYFDPAAYDAFAAWFGTILFERDTATGDKWTMTPMHRLIADITEAGGVAIPAHVGRDGSGFAVKALTKSQDAILSSAGVLAVEVDSAEEFDWFSPEDAGDGSSERKRQMSLRARKLGLKDDETRLAKVRFSDAHRLDQIGRNRDGQERLTRFKMSEPTFEGFRTALIDGDARVRLEDTVPQTYPQLVGARFVGGFLDGQEIRFSGNLTCLIGGRGTGKSTALNAIRCACLNAPPAESEAPNFPQTLQLIYRDAFGQVHYLQRDSGGKTVELTAEGSLETDLPVDGYAQNRVTEITSSYGEDPRPLLQFLDGFVDLHDTQAEISSVVDLACVNAEAMSPLRDAEARLADAQRRLADADSKLGAIERSRFKAAYEWKRKLDQERRLREAVSRRLETIGSEINDLNVGIALESVADRLEISDLTELPSRDQLIGAGNDAGLSSEITALSAALVKWKAQGVEVLDRHMESIDALMKAWQARDRAVEARYQQVVQDLREQGIAPDLAAINRLLTEQAAAKAAIATAQEDQAKLAALTGSQDSLLTRLRQAQAARFHAREHALARITSLLNQSIDDFRVKISFEQGDLVESYEDWLRTALANKFFRAERLAYFCRLVHPIDLASWTRSGNVAKLVRLTDASGTKYFAAKQDAEAFVAQLGTGDLDALSLLDVTDRPSITLVTDLKGTPTKVPFENLSLGQKASVLLGALLFADDSTPLIIDQPEDHLDSRFIFGTVVANLRHVKERRQVIVATHNANIAILGDAEMIVPLQGWKGLGVIREPGSVDARKTRSRACDILEGGTTAYTKRGEMYGLLDPAVRRRASFSSADA